MNDSGPFFSARRSLEVSERALKWIREKNLRVGVP